MFSKITYLVIASYVALVVTYGVDTTHSAVKRTVKDFFSKK